MKVPPTDRRHGFRFAKCARQTFFLRGLTKIFNCFIKERLINALNYVSAFTSDKSKRRRCRSASLICCSTILFPSAMADMLSPVPEKGLLDQRLSGGTALLPDSKLNAPGHKKCRFYYNGFPALDGAHRSSGCPGSFQKAASLQLPDNP